MRLVAKLTLALVLGMSVVLTIFGYRSVRREQELLDNYRSRGDQLILHSLSISVLDAWRHDGEAAAHELIEEADRRGDGLHLRWVWLDAARTDAFAPAVSVDTSKARNGVVRIERVFDGEPRDFVYALIDVGEGRPGAIELSESLEESDLILRSSVESAALAVAALAVLGGIMALGLGAYFVGRPVQAIVDKTRRIGEGDLAGPLDLQQNDELGLVAREINVMSARLEKTLASLAKETAARISTLQQLRHADRLSTVGKLASGIAHELGTPLNVVSGRAKRILRGAPAEEANDNARIIVEQTDRMTRIIRQLLDFARRRGAQKAPGDVGAIAAEVLALLQPLAHKRGIELTLADGSSEGRADIDLGQIQQALTNLVMNGIQAMHAGGRLTVSLAREQAVPPPSHGGAEASYLAIRVADEGEGIKPEHLPHVFEPFFTTKDVGEGTGLGLSVTWGIVEEHGGWIDVQSALGEGTTFTIHLPAR
ncbi:Sensor histidine kinase [Minicystis rosea]|nr:Sensor histidine kinase [Minicystis rosea]